MFSSVGLEGLVFGDIFVLSFEPGKVLAGGLDHVFGDVGADAGMIHKQGFLKNDAGAAERIEDDTFAFVFEGEIDDDLGEFRREHADFGVAGGTDLVACSVGFDILAADRDGVDIFEYDDFDMVRMFAEVVMETSS